MERGTVRRGWRSTFIAAMVVLAVPSVIGVLLAAAAQALALR
jgi:hypothetical protein